MVEEAVNCEMLDNYPKDITCEIETGWACCSHKIYFCSCSALLADVHIPADLYSQ